MKKILIFLLVFAMLAATSCSELSSGEKESDTNIGGDTTIDEGKESDTEPQGSETEGQEDPVSTGYSFAALTVNGTPIGEYILVCGDTEEAQTVAEEISGAIYELTGIQLATTGEGKSIVVGQGKAAYEAGGCGYMEEGGNLYVDGDSGMLSLGARALLGAITAFSVDATILDVKREAEITGAVQYTAEELQNLETVWIYISKEGSDEGKGTKDSPLLTLEAAHKLAYRVAATTPAQVQVDVDLETYGVTVNALPWDYLSGRITPTDAVKAAYKEHLPGVLCWGDSMTFGDSAAATMLNPARYPTYLARMFNVTLSSGIVVQNYGVGGENAATIVGRSGAIPFVVSEAFTIPAEKNVPVEIKFTSEDGTAVAPLRQGGAGLEWVSIDGIRGTLNIVQESHLADTFSYTFTRTEAGEAKEVAVGTEIVTRASTEELNYLPIVYILGNKYDGNVDKLISQQRALIERQTESNHPDRFIVIGFRHNSTSNLVEEVAMEAEFGDRFINLRLYLSTVAIYEAGITPTLQDYQKMAYGMSPSSLMSDSTHLNDKGYELLARLVYTRMDQLGYFDEIRAAAAQ